MSDISGAFDRVSTELMLQKAARTGLSPSWLKFLNSYLAPRQAVVVVEGVESDPFIIKDMLFQGTVLGPMLWNVFFSDIAAFVDSIEFEEQRFADDLSVFKEFDNAMLNDEILSELHKCQKTST